MRERGPQEPPKQSLWTTLAFFGTIWYTEGKAVTLLWGRCWRTLLDYLSKGGGFVLDKVCPSLSVSGDFFMSVTFVSLPQGRLLSSRQTGKGHDFCRVYRYGSMVRVVYFKRQTALSGWETAPKKEHLFLSSDGENQRFEENIIRARSRILELAMCNAWENFATLTLDPLKYDRYRLHEWKKDLSQWIRDQRKRGKGDLRYLLIPEMHQDGAWHMHGLLAGIPVGDLQKNGNGYLDWPRYRAKFGFISLDGIKNSVAVSRYITKYVRKDTEATAQALGAGRHLFYHSAGLKGKELVLEGEVSASADFWQWENDFVKSTWMEASEYERCVIGGNGGENART